VSTVHGTSKRMRGDSNVPLDGKVIANIVNDVTYDKQHFLPFNDERDHLGRLIDSVSYSTTIYL